MAKKSDIQISAHFKLSEFACRDNCGFDRINPKIVYMCEQLRIAMNEPIRINSGCRCAVHNKRIGSTSPNHVHGNAADLSCKSGHVALFEMAKKLYAAGKMPGLEFALLEGSWLHIDCDRPRANGIFQKL